MDHAAAHERLADLALEPHDLARLLHELEGWADHGSPSADAGLLAHVRGCPSCLAELAVARRLDSGLQDALSALPSGERLEPIDPPAALRASVLAGAAATRPAGSTAPVLAGTAGHGRLGAIRDALAHPRWATAIAALVVVALLAGLAGSQIQQLRGGTSADSLVSVVSTVERVLESPTHRVVSLQTASGAAAGSVAWSKQDFAVLASDLTSPPSGEVYRCWLVWAGQADEIGEMDFAGPTAYWTGTTGSWASVTFEPGTRFEVTLEPASSAIAGGPQGQPVLSATLGD